MNKEQFQKDTIAVFKHMIKDKSVDRYDFAEEYAYLLHLFFNLKYPVPFMAVNKTILKRYKPSGLNFIKDNAWKLAQGKKTI